MDEEAIKITKEEFIEKAENLKRLTDYQEKFFEYFLKIKIAFLSFVGIIITVVLANKANFSNRFLVILSLISVIAFALLILELCLKFIDQTRALGEQYHKTALAKIRHIATLNSSLSSYGKRAEELLIQENKMEQKLLNKESLSEIIKYPENKFPLFMFVIWLMALIITPILLLLEVLGKLK